MENLQKLSLDIMNNHSYEYIFANQYDVGRTVEITITDDDNPMDLTGVTAIFSMLKPDGTYIANSCTVSGSIVTVIITEQMTAYEGKSNYQIVLKKDKKVISTIKGTFVVESAAVNDDAIESKSESSMWEDIITRSDETERYWEDVKSMVAGGVNQNGLIPHGNVTFSQLLALQNPEPKDMYTITTPFISTSDFQDGGGVSYPSGTTVYRTAVNKWATMSGAYFMNLDTTPSNGALQWHQPYTPELEPSGDIPPYCLEWFGFSIANGMLCQTYTET